MVRILGRGVATTAQEYRRRGRRKSAFRRSDRKGEERTSSHFLFPPKRGRRRARTPFEPWAQKLAHWSPGYCINAAGSRIIFVGKCNEGKRESESGEQHENEKPFIKSPPTSTIYRVNNHLGDLGWVNFDLDVPPILTSCSVHSAKLPSAQAHSGTQWNSQPNPSTRGSPCIYVIYMMN